jgi:hypothetical protein
VEQVASRQIGISISQYGLKSTIQRLYNARTRKGLFTVTRDAAGVTLAASLDDASDQFFDGDRAIAPRFPERPRGPHAET